MFRHIVLFRWSPEATSEQVDQVFAAIRELPAIIGGVRSFAITRDAGVSPGNHDAGIVADFDDVDAFVNYRDHPKHQEVIRELIAPILAERAAMQCPTPVDGG